MPCDPIKAKERKRRYLHKRKIAKYGSDAADIDMRGRHSSHVKGSDHPRWNTGQILSEHGYVKVRVGSEHPFADPNGYAYEHLIVWLSAGRLAPNPDEVIHHKDEDKTNNRIENLELKPRSEHTRDHDADRERDTSGRFVGKRTGGTKNDDR